MGCLAGLTAEVVLVGGAGAARLHLAQWLWASWRAGRTSHGVAGTPGVQVGWCGAPASRWRAGPCLWSWEAGGRVPEGHPPTLVLPWQARPLAMAAASVSTPGASCCLPPPRGCPRPAACLPQAPSKPPSQVSLQTVCRVDPLSATALCSREHPPCRSALRGGNCGVAAGGGELAVFPLGALGTLGELQTPCCPGFSRL